MLGYLYGYYNGYISIYYQPLTKKTQHYTMAPPSFDWWMQWCRGRPVQRRATASLLSCDEGPWSRIAVEIDIWRSYRDHVYYIYVYLYICIYIYHLSYNSIEK